MGKGIFLRGFLLAVGMAGVVVPQSVSADSTSGLQWLASQARSDGSFSTVGELATPYQATSEAIRTFNVLHQASHPAVAPAIAFVGSESYAGTEYLSRKIIANAELGLSTSTLVAQLMEYQNTDGGFAEFLGYESRAVDSALALEAIAVAGYGSATGVSKAVQYLIGNQTAGGSWWDFDETFSETYTTALVTHSLWRFRSTFSVSTSLNKAKDFLLSKRNGSGLWPEVYETASALISLSDLLTDHTILQVSLTALAAQQQGNGSYLQDAFSTALALRALNLGSQASPDLIVVRGTVVDADTRQALSNVLITLSGPTAATVHTPGTGSFELLDLVAGSYSLKFELPNYQTVTANLLVAAGDTLELGQIVLLKTNNVGTPPTTGTLRGVVSDSAGAPIAGATVTANSSLTASTAGDGSYLIANVPAGAVTVTVSAAGYSSASGSGQISGGGLLIFSPKLPLNSTGQTQPSALTGVVLDGTTNAPLAGVLISITGSTTASGTTDASGAYRISPLVNGNISITATKTGYQSANAVAKVTTNTTIQYSPKLYPQNQSPPANANTTTLRGIVVDSSTNQPLSNVKIEVRPGAAEPHQYWRLFFTAGINSSYITLSDVEFKAEVGGPDMTTGGTPIAESVFNATYALAHAFDNIDSTNWANAGGLPTWVGYRFNAPVTIREYSVRSWNDLNSEWPQAWSLQYSDNGAQWATADVVTGETFVIAQRKTYPVSSITAQTAADGTFVIPGISTVDLELSFAKELYRSLFIGLAPPPLDEVDMGQVRLRLKSLDRVSPDLTVTSVNAGAANTTPDTLMVSGSVVATIKNAGTDALRSDVDLIAFYDANFDQKYDPAIDLTLGQGILDNQLAVDQSGTAQIQVSGLVPFRSPPISVVVNPNGNALEPNQNNNVGTSGSECLRQPGVGTFAQKVKWRWSGSPQRPTYKSVLGPAVVAQLNDDNSDGLTNSSDYPDAIFPVFEGQGSTGYLTAVNGANGQTLWQSTQTVTPWGGAAVGDIDGDGFVEIAIENGSGTELMLFDRNGQLKWAKPSGFSSRLFRDFTAIADLNGDGKGEIILGAHVFDKDGNLLWAGKADQGNGDYAITSTVADIDLDGVPNIIAGRYVYRGDGQLLWIAGGSGDGYTAIGNFNSDPFAEIVLVRNSQVSLFDHNGLLLWGPVALPLGGVGGPPTVADVDGDGQPEIGVAAARRYTVFETDGSIKWSAVTQDVSSNQTGSSVFDMDGDGHAEVLYADEQKFFIYDGATGSVRASIENRSSTVVEYPVVVDIDNDGHAEILVGSDVAPTIGLTAFEGVNDDWMPTRSIWNEHSYHITNINDDGSIPRTESPSWLANNTYRLNAFLNQNPLLAPDLSASLLRVIDNGTNQPLSLQLRVGNGGSKANPTGLKVSFYDGDPNAGGTLVGQLPVPVIELGHYTDLRLNGVTTLSGTKNIYAVVDPDQKLVECNETNNSVSGPYLPSTPLGDIEISTDATSYPVDRHALLTGVIANVGQIATAFSHELLIEDLAGAVLERYPLLTGTIGAGQSQRREEFWNTEQTKAGVYRAHAVLRTTSGTIVDEDYQTFEVLGGSGTGPAATLRLGTDRTTYHTSEQVRINNLVKNLITNHAIPGALLRVSVNSPDGSQILSSDIDLGELVPGGQVERLVTLSLNGAAEGSYVALGQLLDGTGALVATSQAMFLVANNLAVSVTGNVSAQHATLSQGQTQLCTDVITNNGTSSVSGLQLRRSVLRLDQQGLISSVITTVDIATGATSSLNRSVSTAAMNGGAFACTLEAFSGGKWIGLGNARFAVQPEAVHATAAISSDRNTYAPNDQVQVTAYVGNEAQYRTLSGATLRTEILAPDNSAISSNSSAIADLPPGQTSELTSIQQLQNAAEGDYVLHVSILDNAGQTIANGVGGFHVRKTLAQALAGAVSVASSSVEQGVVQTCSGTLSNSSLYPLAGVEARHLLSRVQPAEVLDTKPFTVDVPASGAVNREEEIQTESLDVGNYLCALEVSIGGTWAPLAHAEFEVTPEAAHISVSLAQIPAVFDSSGSLALSGDVHSDMHYRSIAGAHANIEVKSASGVVVFSQSVVLDPLDPQVTRSFATTYTFMNLDEGQYTVTVTVLDADEATLATAGGGFEIRKSLNTAISGSVAVAQAGVQQGQTQSCMDTLTNSSAQTISALSVRQIVLGLSPASTISSVLTSQNLAPNASITLNRNVATSALTGDYRCTLEAQAESGFKLLGSADFSVAAEASNLTTGVGVDRTSYDINDQVLITAHLESHMQYRNLAGLSLQLDVTNPAGTTAFSQDVLVSTLVPGATADVQATYAYSAAAEGTYIVHARVLDAAGALISSADVLYQVRKSLTDAISGSVTVAQPNIVLGDNQTCTDTVNNGSQYPVSALTLRQVLARIDQPQTISTTPLSINLAANSSSVQTRVFATSGLAAGDYACRLDASLNNQWVALGSAGFRINAPSSGTQIDASLSLGSKGRVLVLMDGTSNGGAEPNFAQQKTFIESLLTNAGWSYKIVTDATGFASGLRSGQYNVYAFMSESIKLDGQVQEELREAVFRGDGLLESGSHDQRNSGYDEAMGTKYKGKWSKVTGVEVLTSDVAPSGYAPLLLGEKALRADLVGAISIGKFLGTNGNGASDAAVTKFSYGSGRTIYFGHDGLAEAAAAGTTSMHAQLILQALDYLQPAMGTGATRQVVPVRLTLTNHNGAATGRTLLTLPANTLVTDAGGATVDSNGRLAWSYSLTANQSKSFAAWIKLPAVAGNFNVSALVQIGTGPVYTDHTTASFTVNVQAKAALAEARTLAASSNTFKNVKTKLDAANTAIAASQFASAQTQLLAAANECRSIGTAANTLRQLVDQALWENGQKL